MRCPASLWRGLFLMSLALSGPVLAQWGGGSKTTVVPALDEEGRRGEVARLAQQKAEDSFNAADTNKDGNLSREEMQAANMSYLLETFEQRDANKDGVLSWEEYVGHNRWKKSK